MTATPTDGWPPAPEERTFTQEQLDEIVARRIARNRRDIGRDREELLDEIDQLRARVARLRRELLGIKNGEVLK